MKVGLFCSIFVTQCILFISGECPCQTKVDSIFGYLKLTCNEGAIRDLPKDITGPCAGKFDFNEIVVLQLTDQPLTTLKANCLADFPNLQQAEISFSDVKTVNKNAFAGVPDMRSVYLLYNNISSIPPGTFDSLFKLRYLDIRYNDYLDEYVSNVWYHCHEKDFGDLKIFSDAPILQDVYKKDEVWKYCNHWMEQNNPLAMCKWTTNKETQETIFDCTGMTKYQSLPGLACRLRKNKPGIDKIVIKFPKDNKPIPVQDFGTQATFFEEFNGKNIEFNKIKKDLTLYGTKFDLATLPTFTSNVTNKVTVKADTVFMSGPLDLTYHLTIRARIVSLTEDITMTMDSDSFISTSTRAWLPTNRRVAAGQNLILRHRSLGLVDILDQAPDGEGHTKGMCDAKAVPIAEIQGLDIADWFDSVNINVNYVCARSLMDYNPELAEGIANYHMKLLSDRKVVQDLRAYIAGRKFKRIQDLLNIDNGHNVPSYTLQTIEDLSTVMHDKLVQYRATEVAQEEQLFNSEMSVTNMQVQFNIAEQQQEIYFQMEKTILDEIFAATDNAWHWSFEHRNASDSMINGALGDLGGLITDMQEQQIKQMLNEAKASVQHSQEVVDKYETQVERFKLQAAGSNKVQSELLARIDEGHKELDYQFTVFQINAAAWAAEQMARAAFGIFGAVLGIIGANFQEVKEAEELLHTVEQMERIIAVIIQLYDAMNTLYGITSFVDGMSIEDINEITLEPEENFMTVIENAVDLKLHGKLFDEIQNTGRITIDALMVGTNNGISGTSSLIMAFQSLADSGHQLVDEVVSFADVMMSLVERNDEYILAQADLERAVKLVEEIEQMLEDLQAAKEDYENSLKEKQEAYEKAIEEMKAQYENMTAELRKEFQENITKQFDVYKEQFNTMRENYNVQMDLLMNGLKEKAYSLKINSLNLRSMLQVLYTDYCDATFYFGFIECDPSTIPLMSDDFDVMLSKLNNLRWDILANVQNVPGGTPTSFGPSGFIVEDQPDEYLFPVTTLVNNLTVSLNLADYINNNGYWRVRIEMIRMLLLDKNGKPVPSAGSGFDETIDFVITHPLTFNDTNQYHEKYSFLGQYFYCPANYYTEQDSSAVFQSCCKISSEFSSTNFKPSFDGLYTFELRTPQNVDLTKVAKLKVEFGGSYIPYTKESGPLIGEKPFPGTTTSTFACES